MDTKSKIIISLSAVILICLFVIYKLYTIPEPVKADNSLLEYRVKVAEANADSLKIYADSVDRKVALRLKEDLIKDSLFKVKFSKIKYYPPAKRNQVYDSIYGKTY